MMSYITSNIGITNEVLKNAIWVGISLVMCCGLAEIYLYMKRYIKILSHPAWGNEAYKKEKRDIGK